MQKKRTLEAADKSSLRQMNDSSRKVLKRAEEQSLQRKQAYQNDKRAMESHDETLHGREQNHACIAKRASKTSVKPLHRKEQNQACTAKKRASVVAIETYIIV